ncbi:HTH-type transcriptional regulator DmlR [Roseivivax jejudonensis]|uniref:HTH-type transcriptional regulator DmlR n=1 Tax=Roseivivax jejudonensis TaxID=1529041 RepID=A0A1X7A0L0_9RHOB|nr:LysR family transcriptional regulator [Roseivivax jejudonensis]SLN67111.1 HTH-type transcriptional regulator DmlR [Roseivivax jejudonensis]
MDNWDEIRTAFQVARRGTVSGAAEELGVHHATVIRHIDALEGRLGVKLFQRHARGYTPTEAGEDLLRVAQTTDEQFQQLAGRIRGRGSDVSGDLIVTSVITFATLMIPALAAFRALHPEVRVRYITDDRVFRLEYGEAHVALRAGNAPQEPDNVVQKFPSEPVALYASQDYLKRRGVPKTIEDMAEHDFVGPENLESRAPFYRWLREHIPDERLVLRSTDTRVSEQAILAGAGIGFFLVREARYHKSLVQLMPPQDEWTPPLWLVTHVDLHRTAKVQAFLKHLKEFGQVAADV